MRKHMNKMLAVMLAGVMALGLCGCGSSNGGSEAGSEAQATQSQASGDKVYKIGICQLVQHQALDAATKGFKEALMNLVRIKLNLMSRMQRVILQCVQRLRISLYLMEMI